MNSQLIALGIQAVLRAAQSGAALYKEHARDRRVFLPNLELPEGSRAVRLTNFLLDNPHLAGSEHEFARFWNAQREELISTEPALVDEAYAIMLTYKVELELVESGRGQEDARRDAKMLAAGCMIEQWREERRPPNAIARMGLTLTDIGLEYVASNPSVLGVGSRGEKLIVAFANNLTILIPDEIEQFGPATDFADRLVGIFARAGLVTLSEKSSAFLRDEDVVKLVRGVTKPIIDAMPKNISEQMRYRDLVDTLAGPSAAAAFKLLADNTDSYLGKNFADDKALGAVTTALFEEIRSISSADSIVDVLTEEGVIRLYKAGLEVAVARPELFIDANMNPQSALYRELLSRTANILRQNPRFEGPIGASLAALTVSAVGRQAPALLKLDPNQPWERITEIVLSQITSGLGAGLSNSKGAFMAFRDDQLLELGRTVLEQVAKTPGMIGVDRTEVKAILSGIAHAMAADENLLLSPDDWLEIATIATETAAANPGRLFGLSADDTTEALATHVMRSVLDAASQNWSAAGRASQPLLFGDTLKVVLEMTIEALAGRISGIAQQPARVGELLGLLLDHASHEPNKYGSETLLAVLSTLLQKVLATGELPTTREIDDAIVAIQP